MPEIITSLGMTEAQAAALVRKLRDHDDFDMRKADEEKKWERKRAADLQRMKRLGATGKKPAFYYEGSMSFREYMRLMQKEGTQGAGEAFDWYLKRERDSTGRR